MANETTLGSFCPFIYGKGLPSGSRNSSGSIPVYGSNGIVGWHDVPYTKGPTVIIGRKGTVGAVHYSPTPCWPIDTTFFIEYSDPQDARFTYYLLKTLGLESMNSDSAVPGLNRNAAHLKTMPLYDKTYRHAISHILGALDDKIELNRQMCKTLEDTAQAIFKNWFVDFDPVHAKAAGKQPQGMKPEIATLFPDSFIDTEKGKIPKGWSIRPIGEMVKVYGGGTPSTREPSYWIGGIHPFCTPKDMSALSEPILLSTERKITDYGIAKINSGQLPLGTVLLSSRAPIGYLAISRITVSINQGIIAMICDCRFPNIYAIQWTRSNLGLIISQANGSTFLEISKSTFRLIKAIVPTVEVLNSYMGLVEPLYSKIEGMLLENQLLIAIRDELLPKLISGDLRISDAERIVGRSV